MMKAAAGCIPAAGRFGSAQKMGTTAPCHLLLMNSFTSGLVRALKRAWTASFFSLPSFTQRTLA